MDAIMVLDKMKKLIFFTFVFLILTACPVYTVKYLSVKNLSESTIYFYDTCSDTIEINRKLRDTIIFSEESRIQYEDSIYTPNYVIEPDSIGYQGGYDGHSIHHTFGIPCRNKNYVTIFFIADSTIQKYSWSEIVKHQYHLEKRRYTKADLDSLDWEITYP